MAPDPPLTFIAEGLLMTVEERPGAARLFVSYFKPPAGVICHPFAKLGWAVGCPYACDFCYLWLTLRTQRQGAAQHPMIVWTNYWKMARDVGRWANREGPAEYLNAGELADALAFGDYSKNMILAVRPYLREDRGLYLLTKSEAQVLTQMTPDPNIIVAFSVNAPMVTALYEKRAPSTFQRVSAAMRLREQGWRVRIRLDPMLPIKDWERGYEQVIEWINLVKPERVTLGTLRAAPALRYHAPASDVWELLGLRTVGGKRHLAEEVAATLYRFALKRLECPEVSLCKESPGMWKTAGLSPEGARCVCLA